MFGSVRKAMRSVLPAVFSRHDQALGGHGLREAIVELAVGIHDVGAGELRAIQGPADERRREVGRCRDR